MNTQDLQNCETLRNMFEGRDAIYVEKGVLRVRVFDIQFNASTPIVTAEIIEIATSGLEKEQNLFWMRRGKPRRPLRWSIEAGHLTTFSESTWQMGYGGWSIFFAPQIVSNVVALAASWPEDVSAMNRYNKAIRYLNGHLGDEPSKRLFQDL